MTATIKEWTTSNSQGLGLYIDGEHLGSFRDYPGDKGWILKPGTEGLKDSDYIDYETEKGWLRACKRLYGVDAMKEWYPGSKNPTKYRSTKNKH